MHIIITFIIVCYLLFFLFLNRVYFALRKYYKKITYKEKETGKEIDIEEKFPYMVPKDNFSYFSIVIIGILVFPIRLFLFRILCLIFKIHLKILKRIYINHEKDEKQRLKLEKAAYFWLSIFFFISNIKTEKKEIKYETVYKKYLGEDYDFSQKNFSLYISNHLSYLDLALFARDYGTSFLVWDKLKRNPLIGQPISELGNIWVELESEKSRKNVSDIIIKRQNDFYNKKSFIKTLIFPDARCTNGKYILNFHKGAFSSLLPIKPLILIPNEEFPCCCTDFFYSLFRIMATFKVKIIYAELPVIKPTNYMFEKYKNLGKEKWEIFANVVNKIYSEVGGFKQISIKAKDIRLYKKIVNDGFYIDK